MTDERLETRGESQQAEVANAPPFEIGELSRLGNAIIRSGMRFSVADLMPVINVPADDAGTIGNQVTPNAAMRKIRDLLIWLTRNEPTEAPEPAAEPSEPAAVDREFRGTTSATSHNYSWSINDEEFYGQYSTQREAIEEAVKHIKDQGYIQGEVRTIFVGANEEADDYLNEISAQFADRFRTWMNENVIHEFCWDDSPYDLKVGSESEFGKSIVALMQKHGYFNQFRTANSRRFDIEITDIGWFNKSGVILDQAAEPAGETAR